MSHRRGRPDGRRTYGAMFQHYANRISGKSQLSSISLANVLSGDTCSPISLGDFEDYLTYQEYSIENLQFIVWFQDYRERFLSLPDKIQAASPGRKDFTFAVPTPARTAERVADSIRKADRLRPVVDDAPTMSRSPSSTAPAQFSHSGDPSMTTVQETHSGSRAAIAAKASAQPFRTECMHIVATFFKPGAAKELPLDPVVRDTVIRELTWNTHPDVFLPAYEEISHMLESTSLPRFLTAASANINLPKQLFWYSIGITNLVIGIVVAVVLICTVPAPPQASRAWRLFSVPFAGLGFMQAYSAWRGFCSQVWGRGHTQLRAWEMQEMDEEAAHHWERVLRPNFRRKTSEKGEVRMTERVAWNPGAEVISIARQQTRTPICDPVIPANTASDDMGAIAPFTSLTAREGGAEFDESYRLPGSRNARTARVPRRNSSTPEKSFFTRCSPRSPRLASFTTKALLGNKRNSSGYFAGDSSRAYPGLEGEYRRPLIFGPEKVVLDPRIQSVHRQVMRDLLYAGFWFTLAFTGLVLSVPALHR